MKRIIFISFCLILLTCNSVSAAPEAEPQGLMNKVFAKHSPTPANNAGGNRKELREVAINQPAPDYISKTKVPLNAKEWKALKLSNEWMNRKINPIMQSNGKVVYVFGATLPTIICTPLMASDLELQPGENVNDVIVGDTARWIVVVAQSGVPGRESTHLVIKPLDAGLVTTAVITTDRRTYHLKLVSRRKGYTPYVAFIYPEDQEKVLKASLNKKRRKESWETTEIEGKPTDISALDFGYAITGDEARWKPMRVYNDGIRTFIQLPRTSTQTEIPVLLVEKAGEEAIVNYRVKGNAMIVDEIFEKAILVAGTGMDQEKVEIKRLEDK
ncbi:MAG: P-type conjugative transfer protein TrbG [Desulfovibrio sp. S3730MH75]|nr:MAG: P-type conjugative transfer protein TrbG [Desulfovibrio sp. S3730MH75]